MIESPPSSEPDRDGTAPELSGGSGRVPGNRWVAGARGRSRHAEPRLGDRAARVLAAEWDRHPAPRNALVLGADANSAVLDALLAGAVESDSITVVAPPAGVEGLRDRFAGGGPGPDPAPSLPRVRLVRSIAEAEPAGIVLVAEPLTGDAGGTRETLGAAAGKTAAGGVLSVAGVAGPQSTDGAAVELDRQAAFYGAGSDLVLRNRPPVRVHRLRFTPADPLLAERLGPAYRTSSVPLTGGMHLDSSGVAAAGALLGVATAVRLARPGSRAWLVPALAALPVAAFFRDPQRNPPEDPAAIVAASDGRVLSVVRLRDDRFGGPADWLRIATFLSVLDAHVNRSPVAGRVADFWVETGGFAAAMKPAAEHNVSAYTVVDTAHGRVVVVQRTGLVARRIVQRAPTGALLARGERFGLIRFGSRTDVYLPGGAAEPLVAEGERILAGSTAIARWR